MTPLDGQGRVPLGPKLVPLIPPLLRLSPRTARRRGRDPEKRGLQGPLGNLCRQDPRHTKHSHSRSKGPRAPLVQQTRQSMVQEQGAARLRALHARTEAPSFNTAAKSDVGRARRSGNGYANSGPKARRAQEQWQIPRRALNKRSHLHVNSLLSRL